jgi:cytochrome bd ubiquinol oxidase subunit I
VEDRSAFQAETGITLDPLFLSRLQWAGVIGWHILLPAFTVGLASYIAVLEGLYFFSGKEIWFRISRLWTKIFSVSFAIGVVSGIVMPFQFGTNWSRFSDIAANVISPMLAYEDLMAFFLEATFLGVLLFGRALVPRWVHFFAACMVAVGTLFSSFWILSVNSWMQTPSGYAIKDGRFFPVDWMAIIFNPSFPYRLAHNVSAFYVTTGFVVLGVGAYLVLSAKYVEEGKRIVLMALGFLTIFCRSRSALAIATALIPASINPPRSPRWRATGTQRLLRRSLCLLFPMRGRSTTIMPLKFPSSAVGSSPIRQTARSGV